MTGMLSENATLLAVPDEKVHVKAFIGAGGQGEVYRVATDSGEMALKWYYPDAATQQQYDIIGKLVALNFRDRRFLWPKALVVSDDPADGFGYLMDLRHPEFAGLPALFRRQVPDVTPESLVIACIKLVEAYRALHSKGIAYRDISWGNVFFHPVSGDILVCDNDNAIFEGEDAGVAGTMPFMAPELVRRESSPNTQTDLHSLAVLLFMMLMNHHPLEGARELQIHCLDQQAQKNLYGSNPIFIFDPADDSNRPVRGEHDTVLDTWHAAPQILQNLFTHAFTKGLHDREARVREGQWRDALSTVKDQIVYCSTCGRQNYHDAIGFQKHHHPGTCWNCDRVLALPPRIKLDSRVVMLNRNAKLYKHHVDHTAPHDFSAVIAELTEHPSKPGTFGLKNLSESSWTSITAEGSTREVAPQQSVSLRNGLQLKIAGLDAEIRESSG